MKDILTVLSILALLTVACLGFVPAVSAACEDEEVTQKIEIVTLEQRIANRKADIENAQRQLAEDENELKYATGEKVRPLESEVVVQ